MARAPQVGEAASISPGRLEARSRWVECAEPQSWRWEPRALGKSVRERRGRGGQGLLSRCSPGSAPDAGGLVAPVVSDPLRPPALQAIRLLCRFSRLEYWSGLPFPSPGEIFLTQGWKLPLLHCRQTFLHCKRIPYLCSTLEKPPGSAPAHHQIIPGTSKTFHFNPTSFLHKGSSHWVPRHPCFSTLPDKLISLEHP